MNILLTGASGFIGTALRARLGNEHRLFGLSRQAPARLNWTDATPIQRLEEIGAPIHAVINLAGENMGARRWSAARKQALRSSRIDLTHALARQLADQGQQPAVWINASAVGIYGNRPGEVVSETSPPAEDFAARLCVDWESAAGDAASRLGVQRHCCLRLGVVLGPGGMLDKLRLPFSLGLGAVMGPGDQHMAWISLEDAVSAIVRALNDEEFSGPINAVAPEAANQRRFADTLAAVLHRPRLFVAPAPLLRLLMGQMADLLLFDQRVEPACLQARQFAFAHPTLESALRWSVRVDA